MSDSFDKKIKYKRQYTKLHEAMEKVAKYELKKENRQHSSELDALFIQLFENDSRAHDFISSQLLGSSVEHNKEIIKEKLKENTTNPNKKLHVEHPDNPVNAFVSSMLGYKYHPLKRNNMPYVAFDEMQLQQNAKCLRIGAQTQKSGVVNPVFERYLLANARKDAKLNANLDSEKNENYEYVYFNLMKRNQESQDTKKTGISKAIDKFVRYSEGKRASALEFLNEKEDLKTAVITLPADNEFLLGSFKMSRGSASNLHETCNLADLLKQVKKSIRYNRNDFYFCDRVKKVLFGKHCDNGVIEKLFKNAAAEVLKGFDPKNLKTTFISDEQRNALLFHFIKSKLTGYILEKLNPKAYNFTCKDAIDRGAIHTLWYHFNLFYEKGIPMSEEAFLKYLDAAALIVKYRPLNHNRNLIWNALKHRVESDAKFRDGHPWAITWLNNNLPADQSAFSLVDDSVQVELEEDGFSFELEQNPLFMLKKQQHAFLSTINNVIEPMHLGLDSFKAQQMVRCC